MPNRGATNRRKGRRGELEFASRIGGRRISTPGYNLPDVEDPWGNEWEVKRIKNQGMKFVYDALDQNRARRVAIRQDRRRWIIAMYLDDFLREYYDTDTEEVS